MTKIVADRLGAGRDAEVSQVVTTTMLIALGFGVVGAVAVAAIAPWLGSDVLNIPAGLIEETDSQPFYLLSLSIPLVIFSVCCRGVLEAYQRFGRINAVRIPLGIFTYVGPLLILPLHTQSSRHRFGAAGRSRRRLRRVLALQLKTLRSRPRVARYATC